MTDFCDPLTSTEWQEDVLAAGYWPHEAEQLRERIGMDSALCHCLCSTHRSSGVCCEGGPATDVVSLVASQAPAGLPVPMCVPCGQWWRSHRPQRVVTGPAHVG